MAGDPEKPPTPPPTTEYHLAQSVSNIRNEIPLILDRETSQYSNWVELFEIHCHACSVLDHIDPSTPRPAISDVLWKRLDSIVKKWIYGTISTDLLQTVLYCGATALETWNRIKVIFQDNKNTHAVYLENQFNALHLSNFTDISTYCQQLKSLKDQLANVDQIVSEQKLVLRMVSGLVNTDFDTMASMIQQMDPLASFKTAISRLLLEEARRAQEPCVPAQAFVAHADNTHSPTPSASPSQQSCGGGGGGGGRSGGCG
ncbi:uncharacterized protein LOC125495528 [Beta vulgaris subsp. vulgaris]|uniref:uncharacterized protein LOC125495528 n=1 Tax=Beta vulgaris subsp. vulgaris TaxID=3555 RepID=UPI0020368029|nr:uncharacterized protein LOC125495528 [Beta vulgaris subsp. vulgaris]